MKKQILDCTEKELGKFAKEEWRKILAYLRKYYSLTTEDCEDIFQDSFIILMHNCHDGKLNNLSSSLSTYFTSICINKAHDLLKSKYHKTKTGTVTFDVLSKTDGQKVQSLIAFDPDIQLVEAKEAITRQIVRDLPPPCGKLLWGFYWDNLSYKALADLLAKTEEYVKVTKSRCLKKFRLRWRKLTKHLW